MILQENELFAALLGALLALNVFDMEAKVLNSEAQRHVRNFFRHGDLCLAFLERDLCTCSANLV